MNQLRRTTHPTRARAIGLGLVLAAGLTLAGCGEDTADTATEPTESASQTPSETPTEPSETAGESESATPTEPACARVWVDGETLAGKYTGCFDEEKEKWVEAFVYRCSSGQKVVTFRRNFYAVKGDVIIETQEPLASNDAFQKVLATCGA